MNRVQSYHRWKKHFAAMQIDRLLSQLATFFVIMEFGDDFPTYIEDTALQASEPAPAPTNNAMDAIALWGEALEAWRIGELAQWFGENGKRINAVAQQHHG